MLRQRLSICIGNVAGCAHLSSIVYTFLTRQGFHDGDTHSRRMHEANKLGALGARISGFRCATMFSNRGDAQA